MAIISKEVFYSAVNNHRKCYELIHPFEPNCFKMYLSMAFHALIGSTKFFIFIYGLQMLIKGRKLSVDYIKKKLLLFPKSVLYGVCMGSTFMGSFCLMSHLLGGYYYYASVTIPSFLGGLGIFFENNEMKTMNLIIYFNLLIQFFLNYYANNGFKRSLTKDTIFFMITNAILMYFIRFNKVVRQALILWFYFPKDNTTIKKIECCKKYKCYKHITQDSLKYFGFGYAFQIAKSLASTFPKFIRNSTTGILTSLLLSESAIKSGLFIGVYIFIYESVSKQLYDFCGYEKPIHVLIAGLLSGLSYIIKPSVYIGLMPFIFLLQVLWIHFDAKYKLPNWPFKEILFACCNAILLNSIIIYPDYCPRYINSMIKNCTNNRLVLLVDSFSEQIKKYAAIIV